MSATISVWPTRAPGIPYLWVLELKTMTAAPRCLTHNVRTNGLGVCDECVSAWRRELGADPHQWIECEVCGMPIHPAAEGPGIRTCPTCETAA